MTNFDDDTPIWDEPDWSQIPETPRPRRVSGERTRTHHVVVRKTPLPPLDRARDADFWSDDEWADVDAWVEPLETAPVRARSHGSGGVGVDPRLLRLGGLAAAVVLMVPIALAVRDDGSGDLQSADAAAAASTTAPDRLVDSGATRQRRVREARPTRKTATAAPKATDPAPDPASDAEGDVLSVSATPDESACAGEYTVVAGDYWVRFTESSGADLDAWLNANGATAETPLYAGDVLCIPDGASAPEPPPSTTDAPDTTSAPTTTEAPETTPAPTEAPTTTEAPPPTAAPPATTVLPPPAPVDSGSAEAIIGEIWPDELEERALVIARRESSLQPDAYNGWCCYGLFQIYFDANRSFLAALGVTSPQQLLDARTNATVAYAMYLRSGWGPWSTTDPG
jgi:Transglycosylase SLT domain